LLIDFTTVGRIGQDGLNSDMRLLELFTLLELRDRVSATAETYQKKLIQRFNTAKEEGKLRGASPRVVQMELDKEQNLDAARAIVNYFAEGDPTKNNKYLDWIVRQFIKGHLMWEDSFKMRNLLDDFEKYRKKLEKRDLNQYESYRDLEEAIEPLRGTEVAGIRVQNFLKKDAVQGYRDNMVADPTHPENATSYDGLYGDASDDDPNDMPGWFENEVRERAEEDANHEFDIDEFMDEAREEVNEDDYTDANGDLNDEEYDEAVQQVAYEKLHDAKDNYVEGQVRDNAEEEWTEHVERNSEGYESNLQMSDKRVPELDVVYENDRMAVMIPHSKEVACFLGKGTQWCTGSEESDNYWWEYTKDAPLYTIITDKLGKFQFHFDSSQFMDVDDRYIEDSQSLVSLTSRYSKELEEAFGDIARERDEWWLLPLEEITDQAWEQMLGQTQRGGINSEQTTRAIVRVWQRHHKHAPDGWSEQVRANTLAGRSGELAIKHGWFGKTDSTDMEAAIKTGLHNKTINPLRAAKYVDENNMTIGPELWHDLIMQDTDVLYYAPIDLIDQNLVHEILNDKQRRGKHEPDFLGAFYNNFKELIGYSADPEVKRSHPSPDRLEERLLRSRKIAGMITMDDIVKNVIKYPDSLSKFKMDFGMKPSLAAAREALKHAGSYPPGRREDSSVVDTVQNFLHRATEVIRANDDEPWAQPGGDLMNLIHQILAQHPEEAQSMFRYPEGEMPLDTQNAILNYVHGHDPDINQRTNAAQRLGQAVDAGYFSPEAEELLKRLQGNTELSPQEYERLRQAVPTQQQIDVQS
jgi:hypothetical protein